MHKRDRSDPKLPRRPHGWRQYSLVDIGLYGAMVAATILLIVGTVDVEFNGNIRLAFVGLLLAALLAWLNGKIQRRVQRLAVLLCAALLFGLACVWLR